MHLVLNSFGASLRKEDSLFAVSTAEGKQLLYPQDVRSITVSRAARISSDAVLLAIEHEIDVIFVDSKGHPVGRVWSVQYGSISDIRRKQIDFLYSPAVMHWVKDLIIEKLNNQSALLIALQPNDDDIKRRLVRNAVNSIEEYKRKVREAEGEVISEIAPSLRGWEGAASRRYFQTVSQLLPEAYRFETRSQHPALDPFNALLNYGYGVLYGKIEGALIKAGIDPYAGIFHRDEYNRPALVFDIIERFRVWIDYVVIQLCFHDAFHEECFDRSTNGSVLLGPLGKRILIQSVNDYLSEVVPVEGHNRSREGHIQAYAHQLAKLFLKT